MGLAAAFAVSVALALGVATPVTVTGHHALRDAPSTAAAPVAGSVWDGQIVAVRASTFSWVYVSRLDGTTGWLPRRHTTDMPDCRPEALGNWNNGRLKCGWTLAPRTDTYRTWDYPRGSSPNAADRRVGTDREIELLERVAGLWATAHPDRPLLIGDLSRTNGGPFGPLFGGPGHASHQNGLDVDVFMPRVDRRMKPALKPAQVDLQLARELIGDFGSLDDVKVMFVGCLRDYASASDKTSKLCNGEHENHFHVRLTAQPAQTSSLSDSP